MIKNTDGFILMHPVKEHIGSESLKERMKKFPENDWLGLKKLHERQVKEGEGYAIYHSIWWQEESQEWTKKINSFTSLKFEQNAWIISVQMDYAEIEGPIKDTLVSISTVSLIIIFILSVVLYIILEMDKKRKALEMETKYLKELNKTWDELIKSEARLRHSQKLQTIGLLTSGMVHEFNNLLTPILGYSELLLCNSDKKSSIYEDALEINKSALMAKEVIGQVLSFKSNYQTNTSIIALHMLRLNRGGFLCLKCIMDVVMSIRLLIECKPQHYIPNIIKVFKGVSARFLFKKHPELKNQLWGGHLWNPSYFVGTVSENTEQQIRQYIQNQKKK